MPKASSITAADLSKFTQAAVKAATAKVPGKFNGKGPTIGYILQKELKGAQQLELAASIASGLAVSAKAGGVSGLIAKPVVVIRPGTITVGFLAQELNIPVIQ